MDADYFSISMLLCAALVAGAMLETIRTDPTRMAQGIMTGIGFTFPAIVGTVLTVGILSTFCWVEAKVPAYFFARLYKIKWLYYRQYELSLIRE